MYAVSRQNWRTASIIRVEALTDENLRSEMSIPKGYHIISYYFISYHASFPRCPNIAAAIGRRFDLYYCIVACFVSRLRHRSLSGHHTASTVHRLFAEFSLQCPCAILISTLLKPSIMLSVFSRAAARQLFFLHVPGSSPRASPAGLDIGVTSAAPHCPPLTIRENSSQNERN